MLTFSYKDYRVDIRDTGDVDYWHFNDMDDEPSISNNPAREIVLLAGQILQLVATDVVRAEMKVAGIREGLQDATIAVGDAERSEYEGRIAGRSARSTQSELAIQLKAAETVLQQAKAEQPC